MTTRIPHEAPSLHPLPPDPPSKLPLPPAIVLDTNVLLDWRVFRDPLARPLATAIRAGTLDWVACPSMRTEWSHVWPRACFARWQVDPAEAEHAFDSVRWAPEPPRCLWRCKDPDDQVFINLAISQQARWLLTKDLALLRMAKRAASAGVMVMTLSEWTTLQVQG